MKIQFKDKEIECEQLADGVGKKSETVYYIRDNETKGWLYCSKERLDTLIAKFGTVEKLGAEYVGRAGKQARKAK